MLIQIFSLLFTVTSSHAQINGLKGHYYSSMISAQISSVSENPIPSKASSCQSQIINMSKDGELRILLALGYLDYSVGQDFTSSNSFYTFGDVLDLDARDAFETALVQPCSTIGFDKNARTTACGFSKSGSVFSKNIKDRFTGKTTKIKIKVVSSAYSSNDKQNTSTYASQQKSRSQNAESQYLSALQSYDAVIYLGHARSGGGPDFYPPKLLKSGKVDYAHYKKNTPGFSKMLGALNTNSDATTIGVLACKSTGLFASNINSYAPNSMLVTANNLFEFDDLIPTGFTMLEALTSQRCNDDFSAVLKHDLPNGLLTVFD